MTTEQLSHRTAFFNRGSMKGFRQWYLKVPWDCRCSV